MKEHQDQPQATAEHKPPFERQVYSSQLGWLALGGSVLGAAVGGWIGWVLADGTWPVAGWGQIAASGPPAAAVALGGTGAAILGLAGAPLGLMRIPAP